MKAAAPGPPRRSTVQERRGAVQPATLQESLPTPRGTLQERIPGGLDEAFLAVGNETHGGAKPQSRRFSDWVKTPVGIASVAGGAVCVIVAVVAVSMMGGSAEEQQDPSPEIAAASGAEQIEKPPAEPANTPRTGSQAGDNAAPSQDTAQQAADDKAVVASLAQSLGPAVVRIDVDLAVGSAVGNGFVVDSSGLIATNHHVVKGARNVRVTFADGTTKSVEGFRLMSPEKDIAILQLAQPVGQLSVVSLAPAFPKKGDFSATFGAVRGRALSSSAGLVESVGTQSGSGLTGSARAGTWIQTTSTVSPEISGGPLVARSGHVIGMHTWSDSTAQDPKLAISSVDVQEAIASSKSIQLVPLASFTRKSASSNQRQFTDTFRTTPRAFSSSQAKLFEDIWFGADGVDLSTRNQNELRRAGLRTRTGFFLTIVTYGSPAYKAGLRQKDIIKSVNGNFVSTVDDLSKVVDVAKPGQILKIEALKSSSKGRYQAKSSRVNVTVKGVIPQSAIDKVLEVECPDPAKEFLLLQLLNYGEMLSSACRRATNGSEKEQQRVDSILAAGPFDPVHAPNLSDYSFMKLGIIGRADSVVVKDIVGDKYTLFKSGLTEMLFAGVPTGVFKGSRTDFGVVQIIEKTNYTTEDGEKKQTFVAERFDVGPFLPKGQNVGSRLGEEFKRNERQTVRSESNPIERQTATLARTNLSGVWESTNGDSIFQVIDSGNTVIVRLVSSDTIESLNGVLTRNGETLTARAWQGVFKKDPSRKRHNLQFLATLNNSDSLSIRFTNVLWDGTGRVISQQFDGRGTWSRLSPAAARAALAGNRED